MISASLDSFIERNQRNLDENIHGVLASLATAQALNSGAPINVTAGIGKLIIMLNAGADPNGSIVVTGDTVDRDSGAVTVGNTNTLTAVGLSADTSGVDAQGNTIHALAGGYITSNWFSGAVAISTPGGDPVTLTDVDVYQCSFEQFNDEDGALDTFDINASCTNTVAWLYAYLYSVIVPSAGRVNVTNEATLSEPVGDSEANKYYRLRRSPLNIALNGSTDGIFVDLFFGPDGQQRWRDFSMKVWRQVEDSEVAALEVQVATLAAAQVAAVQTRTAQQQASTAGTAGTRTRRGQG